MWLAGFGAVYPWVSGILASETIEVCSKYGSWDLHLSPGGSRSRLKHTTGRKGLLWEYHDPLIVGCLGQWYGPPSETAGSTALSQDSGNLPCQYITIAGLVSAPHMVLPKGPKAALVGAALGERRSTEKVLEVVRCPWGEPLETRPAKVLKSPHRHLENWQVPDPKVPTSLLDWFWRWHKVVRQVLSHQSEHWLVRHLWGAFSRSLEHAGYKLRCPGGVQAFPLLVHLSGEWSPLHVHPLIRTGHAWDLPQLPGFKMEVSTVLPAMPSSGAIYWVCPPWGPCHPFHYPSPGLSWDALGRHSWSYLLSFLYPYPFPYLWDLLVSSAAGRAPSHRPPWSKIVGLPW